MEQDGRDAGGAGVDAGRDHVLQLVGAVRDPGEHGSDEHATRDAGLVELGHGFDALAGVGRARLAELPDFLVEGADGEVGPHVGLLRGLGEHVEIAQDQGRLGEDREGIGVFGQHLDDAPRQAVLALAALVGIGVGAHGDVLAGPV